MTRMKDKKRVAGHRYVFSLFSIVFCYQREILRLKVYEPVLIAGEESFTPLDIRVQTTHSAIWAAGWQAAHTTRAQTTKERRLGSFVCFFKFCNIEYIVDT